MKQNLPAKTSVWGREDEFYYDVPTRRADESSVRVRSLVGLMPLLAVETVQWQ